MLNVVIFDPWQRSLSPVSEHQERGLCSRESMTAILGNILILIAFHRESSLHPPSTLLLRSLATTDLFAGLFSEPVAITYWMSVVNEHWNICRCALVVHFMTGYILGGASLFTLTTVSVDRLLALLLGLRYRQFVTLKRT